MTDGISIRIDGDLAVYALLDPMKARAAVRRGIRRGAEHVRSRMKEYPPQISGRSQFPGGFVSDKQRRYFFWALKSGEIKVPYKRTGGLRNSWTLKAANDGFTQIVVNNKKYAKLVQGFGFQSWFHNEGGWQTDDDVLNEEAMVVNDMVNDELHKALFRGI